MQSFITWNVSPMMFQIGSFRLMWYGVLFAVGLTLAGWWVYARFRDHNMTDRDFQIFLIWGFVCMFLGCRLGHCLFYQWDYFSAHPAEILLPVKIYPDGHWKFIGYHGLASHGGAVGMVVAMVIFWLRTHRDLWTVMDIVAIGACLAGGFIRLGNLMNSEIIGNPTDVPWAFIFGHVDDLPRHPAQLYEALFYFAEFGVASALYRRYAYQRRAPGFYFGAVIAVMFLFRFLIEFIKAPQEAFEQTMLLDMGQILSIPFVIASLIILFVKRRRLQ